jgi:hypothetical protein
MPYDDPDPNDPNVLVGVALPAGAHATREMAEAFADEFAQMGFDRARLLRLFSLPFYAGAYAALQFLGEAEIVRIVDESLRVYGPARYAVTDSGPARPRSEQRPRGTARTRRGPS